MIISNNFLFLEHILVLEVLSPKRNTAIIFKLDELFESQRIRLGLGYK